MQEFLDALKSADPGEPARVLDAAPNLVHGRNAQGASWLVVSIYSGRADVARLFLDRGAEPDFFESVMLGLSERVHEMLEKQEANVDSFAPDGFTPLALAVFFRQPGIFRYLLERGANVQLAARNPMRVTALHAAAARGDLEAVRMLLERGADANARQQAGFTALHTAAQQGRRDMAELLLAYGADRQLANDEGVLPAGLATKAGHTGLGELLGG